jgi:hypothetical protein
MPGRSVEGGGVDASGVAASVDGEVLVGIGMVIEPDADGDVDDDLPTLLSEAHPASDRAATDPRTSAPTRRAVLMG